MFLCTLIILILCQPTEERSIFDNLPPIIEDVTHQHSQAQVPEAHQFLFNQIGKFATDVHYMHFRIPIHFRPLFYTLNAMTNALNDTFNSSHGRAMGPVLQFASAQARIQIGIIENNLKQIELNMPLASELNFHRRKRFIGILTAVGAIFGIAGTAFGVANAVTLNEINTKLAEQSQKTELLVDIQQIHANHLHEIDDAMNSINSTLFEMVQFNPAYVTASAATMMTKITDIYTKVANAVSQAQLNRLSPLIFPNDVLKNVKTHIDQFAEKRELKSFVNHISDLYQLEASFVYQPNNKTFNIILHVPFVKHEYLLELHQYIPFPLAQSFSSNHTLTPKVGDKDILAFGHMNTFKILSATDLSACHHMGDTYFCKGRNVLQTKMETTCLGSIFARHLSGMKTFCDFELTPRIEQVFELSKNKWQIFSLNYFTTTKVCQKSVTPVTISYSTEVELDPGCKMLLQSNILYAEEEEEAGLEPVLFSWKWNITSVFPEIPIEQFSKAMQSMHKYGLHTVRANDIIQHLQTANFAAQIPDFLSGLLKNPFNYSSGIMSLACIALAIYGIIRCVRQPVNNNNQQSVPSAPMQPMPMHFVYPQAPMIKQ